MRVRVAVGSGMALLLALALPSMASNGHQAGHAKAGATSGGSSSGGFTAPVQLPGSGGFGEPSVVVDKDGLVYVTAPQALGNVTGFGSPVWYSYDGGSTFASTAPVGDPVSGGDTDIVVDPDGNIYQADLWLVNSAMAVATHPTPPAAPSFVANEWGHVQPGDDRPWLAYSGVDAATGSATPSLYLAWDGLDAIHVARSLPLVDPHVGLTFPQDVPAVPECVLGGNNPCSTSPIRQCVCPPGGIAVDPRNGTVYVTYSKQNDGGANGGVGIAKSTTDGLTWSYLSIPGSGIGTDAFDTEWNFTPVKVDPSNGYLYVAWGELQKSGSVAIEFAYSPDGGTSWSPPQVVSTTTGTNVFPTLDVAAPGVVDIAYYGTTATGDPNAVTSTWNLYYARSSLISWPSTPSFAPTVAVSSIHQGCIQAGSSNVTCADRSLLDFFQLADHGGVPYIAYTAGDAKNGTNLYFVKGTGTTTTTSTGGSTGGGKNNGKGHGKP